MLKTAIASKALTSPLHREPLFDQAIDEAFGVIEVAGQRYPASELLFSTDYEAYRGIGQDLSANAETTPPKQVNAKKLLRIRR